MKPTRLLAAAWVLLASWIAFPSPSGPPLNAAEPIVEQTYRYGGLTPAESFKRMRASDDLRLELLLHEPDVCQPVFMSFDERGRLWVVQYRQYPHPAGLKIVSHDQFWRNVYDRVPSAPPNHTRGMDRITIHEDTDGDGDYDSHKVFVDGLNIATAVAHGRGGVWVLNPPYLLFYPDADRDDVPDDDPRVVLSGFGLEDTHAVANSLRWGPDGWLYGAQGSTVTSSVRLAGRDEPPIYSQGQCIWRYHPEWHRYEVFAEGGGNAFGVEIDSKGRIFSGHNGGDTRGFHYVQGGYLQKGFSKHGPLSNPYAFGYFPPMSHHRVERFTHTFLIYEGDSLPERFTGGLVGVEPLQGRVVLSEMLPHGSTFRTHDVERPLESDDDWFRPVDIKLGPDGALYIADWYDGQINHYRNHQGQIDPSNGRIWRLSGRRTQPGGPMADLAALSSGELVDLLEHPNRWYRQTALRLLGDRHDRSLRPRLLRQLADNDGQSALESLWALNLCGGVDAEVFQMACEHRDPFVRAWIVRLACDDRRVTEEEQQRLCALAKTEPNVEVRTQLACSARRLPVADGLPIVDLLLTHDQDVDDPYQPLLLWWAIESFCSRDPDQVVDWLAERSPWKRALFDQHVTQRLARRFAQAGSQHDYEICLAMLEQAPDAEVAGSMVEGIEAAFEGRSMEAIPPALARQILKHSPGSLPLRVRLGDAEAVERAMSELGQSNTSQETRIQWARLLGEIGHGPVVPVLISILTGESSDAELLDAAAAAVRRFDRSEIPETLIARYRKLRPDVQRRVQTVFASRPAWAIMLLEAADGESIDPLTLTVEFLRSCQDLGSQEIDQIIARRWGDLRSITSNEALAEIEHWAEVINDRLGDPYAGKPLFREHCGKCHQLFGEGGAVGPDLTSFDRSNLEHMLLSIVHPSAEIREGFENYQVVTDSGRVVGGLLVDQSETHVTIRVPEGASTTIARDEIELVRVVGRSLMPDGLLKELTEDQVRDLFAYLRSTQPLND